jgi:hypothetical protein
VFVSSQARRARIAFRACGSIRQQEPTNRGGETTGAQGLT